MEVFEMASKSTRYTPEFKRQMVALARSGKTARSLAKEYGPTPWTIALWIRQDQRDAGKGDGGLTTAEREELAQLRRENRKLKEEREILSKAAAWFATESGTSKRSSGS
jgi:transposase